MVTGRRGLGIERQRQVADVIHRGINTRQHSELVVGISAGGGLVPVHTLGAVVHITGCCGDVGIVINGAAGIVDACPAIRERIGIGHGAVVWVVLKAVFVRQCGDETTCSAHSFRFKRTGVAGAADAGNAGGIESVG